MDGSADHISTLPDDVLLQIIESVGSGGGAARTCMLSRRWSDLWTRLPEIVVILHDLPFRSLKAALKDADRPGMFQRLLLDVSVPFLPSLMPSSLETLLLAMAALSPADLRLTLPRKLQVVGSDVELPSFDRATSIELHAGYLRLARPRASAGLHVLKRLSLSGCHVDLAELIPRCPCLRFLMVNTTGVAGMEKLTVHSRWLQELVIESSNKVRTRIHVEAPVLKQLAVRFHSLGDLGVSVFAPMVEKVSWRCSYARAFYRLGLWGLLDVGLLNTTENGVHVLSLHMCAQDLCKSRNAELCFPSEIHKHLVTNFSGLDLHLRTKGHVFGAFVLRLLAMHPIHTASIRNLKVILLRSEVTTTSCQLNCLCDEPKDWRTQIAPLADLESMEIEGVNGEDHELDFLNVIFTSAPVLKRVTLRFVDGVTPCVNWCTKVNNMFMLYPCVEQGQIQWVFHGCHVTFS